MIIRMAMMVVRMVMSEDDDEHGCNDRLTENQHKGHQDEHDGWKDRE